VPGLLTLEFSSLLGNTRWILITRNCMHCTLQLQISK